MKENININVKSLASIVLGVLSLHFLVLGVIVESIVILCIAFIDALLAVFFGIKGNDSLAHSGLILGIFLIIVFLFVIF